MALALSVQSLRDWGKMDMQVEDPPNSPALLAPSGQLDTVDLNKLNEIEGFLNQAKGEMQSSELDRKVSALEREARSQEAAMLDYDRDIAAIRRDVRNLEDIRRTLPTGCFNTPSIEKP